MAFSAMRRAEEAAVRESGRGFHFFACCGEGISAWAEIVVVDMATGGEVMEMVGGGWPQGVK